MLVETRFKLSVKGERLLRIAIGNYREDIEPAGDVPAIFLDNRIKAER